MPDDKGDGNATGDNAPRAIRKSKLDVKKIAVRFPRDPNIDVEAHIKDLIIQMGIAAERVVAEARIREDFGFDDLDFVEFIMAVEETFGVVIPDEVADRIRTVRDAIDTVLRILGRDR